MQAIQTVSDTLTAGDRITEVDTPDGPFYPVLKVNRASVVVDARFDGDTEPLPLRLPHGIVLKAL